MSTENIDCQYILNYFAYTGITDIWKIGGKIFHRPIHGSDHDDYFGKYYWDKKHVEYVVEAFNTWLVWKEATLKDLKDTCTLLHIPYECVMDDIYKKYHETVDELAFDKEDSVCMCWYDYKKDEFHLDRNNDYIDEEEAVIGRFFLDLGVAEEEVIDRIYNGLPTQYNIEDTKKECVKLYLRFVRKFLGTDSFEAIKKLSEKVVQAPKKSDSIGDVTVESSQREEQIPKESYVEKISVKQSDLSSTYRNSSSVGYGFMLCYKNMVPAFPSCVFDTHLYPDVSVYPSSKLFDRYDFAYFYSHQEELKDALSDDEETIFTYALDCGKTSDMVTLTKTNIFVLKKDNTAGEYCAIPVKVDNVGSRYLQAADGTVYRYKDENKLWSWNEEVIRDLCSRGGADVPSVEEMITFGTKSMRLLFSANGQTYTTMAKPKELTEIFSYLKNYFCNGISFSFRFTQDNTRIDYDAERDMLSFESYAVSVCVSGTKVDVGSIMRACRELKIHDIVKYSVEEGFGVPGAELTEKEMPSKVLSKVQSFGF